MIRINYWVKIIISYKDLVSHESYFWLPQNVVANIQFHVKQLSSRFLWLQYLGMECFTWNNLLYFRHSFTWNIKIVKPISCNQYECESWLEILNSSARVNSIGVLNSLFFCNYFELNCLNAVIIRLTFHKTIEFRVWQTFCQSLMRNILRTIS